MAIGPHRRVRWVQSRLADFKEIKNALGGTVNDVVLAVVAGALRRWLRARGVRTEGLELRALVPVVDPRRGRARPARQPHRGDARAAAGVRATTRVERLRIVREAMSELKESKQALGAEVIAGLDDFAPPTLLAQASRLNFSTRLFNLIVTNVPGPQFPLYLLGREMEELVPIAFLPENHALAMAIMSYNGKVDFGLLGDYDAMPDLDDLARCSRTRWSSCSRRRAGARGPSARRPPRKAARRPRAPPEERRSEHPVLGLCSPRRSGRPPPGSREAHLPHPLGLRGHGGARPAGAGGEEARRPKGVQHLHFRFGPLHIRPGSNLILAGTAKPTEKPSEDGYITRLKPNLVTTKGVGAAHLQAPPAPRGVAEPGRAGRDLAEPAGALLRLW